MSGKWKLLLTFMLSLFMTGCMTIPSVFNAPEVTEEKFRVTGVDFDGIEISCSIKVSNRNSVSLDFPGTGWTLFLDDAVAASGTVEPGTKIAPMSSVVIDFPVNINFRDIYRKLPAVQTQETVNYRLETNMDFKLPVFGKDAHKFTHEGVFPIMKRPEIYLENILLTSLEPDQVAFTLTAGIENRNSFACTVDTLSFELEINGKQWSAGTSRRQLRLEGKSDSTIPLNITIKTSEKVSDIYSLILAESDVRYDFSGKLGIRPETEVLTDLVLPFKVTGSRRIKL